MLERFDSCYATVVGASQKGIFLSLENGEEAFAFYNYLPKGTQVLVTKLRETRDHYLAKVSIDSVINDYGMCAA